jgi:hypothetical protein
VPIKLRGGSLARALGVALLVALSGPAVQGATTDRAPIVRAPAAVRSAVCNQTIGTSSNRSNQPVVGGGLAVSPGNAGSTPSCVSAPAVAPESPSAVFLPLMAGAIFGLSYLFMRRKAVGLRA